MQTLKSSPSSCFYLRGVPIFWSVLGLLKTSKKYVTYTNEETQKLVIWNIFEAFLTQPTVFSNWQHKVYPKIFTTWNASSFLGNLKEFMYGYDALCVIYWPYKFQWQPLQTWNTYAVNIKTLWGCRKNKYMFLNIFKHLFL